MSENEIKTVTNKKIAKLIEEFDSNPNAFNDSPLKDLILERKDVADKERLYVKEIKEFQQQIMNKLKEASDNFLKMKGQIEYIENKLLKMMEKQNV